MRPRVPNSLDLFSRFVVAWMLAHRESAMRAQHLIRAHPIFNSFFHLATLDGMTDPDNASAKAVYVGSFDDNDPTKRLQVIINDNNDSGDYMEWPGGGYYPVNMSNDAYTFATNYVIYALTN